MAFKYKPRSTEQYRKRAEQSGGMFDKWIKGDVSRASFKAGDHELRICPPTWKNAEHYGYDIYLHYGVGPDNQVYLCPSKMKGENCPVCEAYAPLAEKAQRLMNKYGPKHIKTKKAREDAYAFKANKRVLMFVINRKEQSKGPQLYDMPWTLDKALTDRMTDKRTGANMNVDDPEEGFDIYFKRTGTGLGTEYTGEGIARESSPMSDKPARMEKWLAFLQANPIPDCLNFFDYDHIAKAFNAAGADEDEDSDDDDDTDDEDKKQSERDAAVARRRAKAKGSKSDDDDDDDDDADEDDDRPSKRKEKSKSDDDDTDDDADVDDDDSSDDDDDADDKPKKKGKTKSKDIDDEDESLDDDPDDKPKKGKSKKSSKSDDDDDDSSDDDDDADGDDADEKPAKRKGKPSDDDDDDDDADDDDDSSDDDDDDDEPKAKKGKSKKSSKSDDDDDSDTPF